MKGKKETELTSSERDELERLIDEEFRTSILSPRKEKLIDFFSGVQSHRFEFRTTGDTKDLEVLDVFYYANCPLSFITIEPSYDFYDPDKTTNSPELDLGHYTYSDIDDLVVKVLEENKIDCSELTDNREFDTAIFWENKESLEMDFIINCWQEAALKTKSKIMAFLYANDGSGSPYYLNNGYDLWKERLSPPEYLERLGVKIAKEIVPETEKEKIGFWKRLFGRHN